MSDLEDKWRLSGLAEGKHISNVAREKVEVVDGENNCKCAPGPTAPNRSPQPILLNCR